MIGSIIYKNVNVGEGKIIFGASLVQISEVDAHSNPSIFLWDRDDVGEPFGILRYHEETGLVLLDDF